MLHVSTSPPPLPPLTEVFNIYPERWSQVWPIPWLSNFLACLGHNEQIRIALDCMKNIMNLMYVRNKIYIFFIKTKNSNKNKTSHIFYLIFVKQVHQTGFMAVITIPREFSRYSSDFCWNIFLPVLYPWQ